MFLFYLILPVISITNGPVSVSNTVVNEVHGENATVQTKIVHSVNGEKTIVESSSPGTISVKTQDNQTTVKTDTSTSSAVTAPMMTISPIPIHDATRSARVIRHTYQENIRIFMQTIFSRIISVFKR